MKNDKNLVVVGFFLCFAFLWTAPAQEPGARTLAERLVITGRLAVPGLDDLALTLQAEAAAAAGDGPRASAAAADFERRFSQSPLRPRVAVVNLIARHAREPFSNLLASPLGHSEALGLFTRLKKQGLYAQAAQILDARIMRVDNYVEEAPQMRELADAWQKSGTNLVAQMALHPDGERRWRYGRLFYRADRYGDAEKLFLSVTPSAPPVSGVAPARFEEGHFYLGVCAMKRTGWGEAEGHFRRFLTYWPEAVASSEDPRAWARQYLIASLERQAKWNEAWEAATNAWGRTGEERYLRFVMRFAKSLGRSDYPEWRKAYVTRFPGSWSIYIQQRDDALTLLGQGKIAEGLSLLHPIYPGRQSELRMLATILSNGDARDTFAKNEDPFFDYFYFDPRGETDFPFPYRDRMEALIDLGERAKTCPDLIQLSRAYLFDLGSAKWQQLSNRGHAFINWVDDRSALPESLKTPIDLLAVLGEKELADNLVRRFSFANDWDRLRARKAVCLAFGQEDQAVRQDLLPIESRRGEWNGLPHEFLRRGFPRWHEPLIAHAASVTGVPRHLIWAVIREESHFDVDALSGAGAQGLMQIMESTGKGLHLQSGTSRFLKMDLLDPVQNVMLGSRYLATLLTMFQGNEMKALAGYNGGEGNVARWQKYNGPFTNDLHFALVVPYDESARYVQKVLRSKWMYDVLYPDSVETWKK